MAANAFLRDMFFEYDSQGNLIENGILKAESIIIAKGGIVNRKAEITGVDIADHMFWNSVDFLVFEYGYVHINTINPNDVV
jgi:hypothetical protein